MNWQAPSPRPGGPGEPIPPHVAPQAPPAMPGPGWYPDPTRPATWRYWDGAHWTHHLAPMHAPVVRDPYSFSAWFEQGTELVKAVVRRVGIAVLVIHLVAYGAATAVAAALLSGRTGDRLHDLVDHLDTMFDGTDDIRDAEWDRARELFGDVVGPLVAIAAVAIVIVALVTVWTMTLTARAAFDALAEPDPAGKHAVVQPPSLVATTMRRCGPVLVASVVLGLLTAVVMAVPLVPFALALVADASPAVVGITVTLGILAAIVGVCWVAGRLSLTLALAARGGHGLGLRRSWELTEGHFWPVVGRLLLAGLLASVVTLPFGFSNSVTLVIGVWVTIAFVVLGQALSGAASVLLVTPAQVLTIDHLEDRRAADRSSPLGPG